MSAVRASGGGVRELMRRGPVPAEAFTSQLRDERTAAILGLALGVAFTVCFVTGIVSHLLQHPQSWFHWPARPVNLYRVNQGLHVMTGIAAIPLLLGKLWVVYPKFWAWPPARGVVHALERLSLLPLVGGALFMLFTGVINIAYWYTPMPYFFPAAHYWVAWLTVGALLVHIGAKVTVTRDAVFRHDGAGAAQAATADRHALTRRTVLGAVGASAGVLFATVAGETVRGLNPLAVLAPRRPDVGPQHLPVNRSAADAAVAHDALDPGYRLVLDRTGMPSGWSWSLAELTAMPQRRAGLPISCVEGWSASADWEGVPLRHLLGLAGLPHDARVRVESLERYGGYRTSVVEPAHTADPDTLLALRVNGRILDLDHGYPLRLIAPNRPGVLQTKWVGRLVVL